MKRAARRRDDDGKLPDAGDDLLARKANQRLRPSADLEGGAATAGIDLTGALSDDVLVRVLELVPDARDLVRTDALSRRWRGLWTRVPALRFASSARPEFTSAAGGGAERYASFVSEALALRAAQAEPAVERLAISFNQMMWARTQNGSPSIVRVAEAWVQYAVDRALKSLDLELRLPINSRSGLPTMALDQLPSTAALETMRLAIGYAIVKLPKTAVFASLTDLSLERMGVEIGSGHHLLVRLLSSACCPRLRKLKLRKLRLRLPGFQDLLMLESGTLSELSYEDMEEPVVLQLRTPNLRVLRIKDSCLNELLISAPRLEILMLDGLPDGIDVDGDLPCMRRLQGIELRSHSYFEDLEDEEINGVGIRLLQCCTSARRVRVFLNVHVPKKIKQVSNVLKGRIPHLPYVTSLTVKIFLFELHSFGDGVSDILAQCNNLKYLCLDFNCFIADLQRKDPKLDLTCDHQDHWKTHEISLVHLKEAEFKGLRGTDCELWFVQSVISSARDLQKLAISFSRKYRPEGRNEAFDLTSLVGDGGVD